MKQERPVSMPRTGGIDFSKLKYWLSAPRALGTSLAIFILIYPPLIGALQAPPPGLEYPIATWMWDLLTGIGASAVIFISRSILKRSSFGRTVSVWLLAALCSAVFPVAVSQLFTEVSNRLVFGIPVSASSVFGLMLIFTIVTSTFAEYRDSNRELTLAVAELEVRRNALKAELSRRQKELGQRISDQVSPRIQAVTDLIQGDQPQKAAQEILNLINNLVRPVSKGLSEATSQVSWGEIETPAEPNRLSQFLKNQLKKVQLSSIFTPHLHVLLAAIFFTDSMSLAALTTGVLYLFGFLGLVFLSYSIMARLTRDAALPYIALHAISLLLALVAGWAFIQGLETLGIRGTTGLTDYVGLGVFLVFSFAGFASIYVAGKAVANADLRLVAARLKAVVGELQLKTAALNRQKGLDLHGDVQAKLQAALVRLSRSSNTQYSELAQVLKDLELATEALLGEKPKVQGLAQFDEIAQLWDGICEVTISIDSESTRSMESNVELCALVAEIVRERVVNAAKHSSAEEIDISIAAALDRLTISAKNQDFVSQPIRSQTAGVGSSFLDAACLNWSLTFEGRDVVFQAEVSR